MYDQIIVRNPLEIFEKSFIWKMNHCDFILFIFSIWPLCYSNQSSTWLLEGKVERRTTGPSEAGGVTTAPPPDFRRYVNPFPISGWGQIMATTLLLAPLYFLDLPTVLGQKRLAQLVSHDTPPFHEKNSQQGSAQLQFWLRVIIAH